MCTVFTSSIFSHFLNTLISLMNVTAFNGKAAREPFVCLQISTVNMYKNKMVCITVVFLLSL